MPQPPSPPTTEQQLNSNLDSAPDTPTVCDVGEDLVIFTSSPSSPMQCQAGTAGDNTGTVMVSDFNKLSKKGFGWVQAGMVCFDLGCDEASTGSSGTGAGAAGANSNAAMGASSAAAPVMQSSSSRAGTSARAATGARANIGPTPAPVAIDANMANAASSGSMFVAKKPVVKKTGTVASKRSVGVASSGRRKLSSAYSNGYTDDMTYTDDQPYSFVSTPSVQSVPIEAPMMTSNPASTVRQQLRRFAICRPRVQQQSWSNSGR